MRIRTKTPEKKSAEKMGNIPVNFVASDGSINMICSQKDQSVICSGPSRETVSPVRAQCDRIDDVNYKCSTVTNNYTCARVDGINGQINVNCKKDNGVSYQMTRRGRLAVTNTAPIFTTPIETDASNVYLVWSQPVLPTPSASTISSVSYQVYNAAANPPVAIGNPVVASVAATATSVGTQNVTVPSLTPGTSYTFNIVATYTTADGLSTSAPSPDTSASITVSPLTPATLTFSGRTVSWGSPTGLPSGMTVTGYNLYRDLAGSFPTSTDKPINAALIPAATTSYTDSTASNGKHTYQLATYYTSGATSQVSYSDQYSNSISSRSWIWVLVIFVIILFLALIAASAYYMFG